MSSREIVKRHSIFGPRNVEEEAASLARAVAGSEEKAQAALRGNKLSSKPNFIDRFITVHD